MNKYLVILYLVIVLAILVVTQIGIRNPWDPFKSVVEDGGEEFELLATKLQREKEAMEKAHAAIQQATPDPQHDELVMIPAGTFLMGSGMGQNNEKPVRTVYLNEYWIDRYEVTMAHYYAFVAATGHREPRLAGYLSIESVDMSSFLYPDRPVVGVSWLDAHAYCQWKGKRLPTEAEWEKAAKGPQPRKWPWGDEEDSARANLRGLDDTVHGTAPVDSYETGQSGFGVYNLTGNVMEWASDWYDEQYYRVMPGENPSGPAIGDEKVIRGGSWHDSLRYAHTFSRFKMLPEYRDVTIGFRCAKSGEMPQPEKETPQVPT
jgi:formylglycine-generating enzyme